MVFDFLLMRPSRLVLCVCLIIVVAPVAARAADPPVRIVLLPAGERASVVVEFDPETPKATAIEVIDTRSFAVEIGPVRTTVANQLLQAATQSPLVSEVRVRSVPQGTEGTLITLHVSAKNPVSGLVRRAQRRIYIDLEPLSLSSGATRGGSTVLAAPDGAASQAAARTTEPVPPSQAPSTPAARAEAVTPGARPVPAFNTRAAPYNYLQGVAAESSSVRRDPTPPPS
jgi:hypothetical protein